MKRKGKKSLFLIFLFFWNCVKNMHTTKKCMALETHRQRERKIKCLFYFKNGMMTKFEITKFKTRFIPFFRLIWKLQCLKLQGSKWVVTKFKVTRIKLSFKLQQKQLNLITLGQKKSDNINRMITLTSDVCLVIFSKWDNDMCSH